MVHQRTPTLLRLVREVMLVVKRVGNEIQLKLTGGELGLEVCSPFYSLCSVAVVIRGSSSCLS